MKYLKRFNESYSRKRCYFAHPMSIYNTEYEKEIIDSLSEKFDVLNPSDKKYQEDIKKYREIYKTNYMKYFDDLVLECDVVAYLPFTDYKIGAGVYYEALKMFEKGGEVYEIDYETYEISKVDIDYIERNKLSIDETRERIKKPFRK